MRRGEEFGLLSETEAGDKIPITGHVLVVQVAEESAPLSDHFEESAAPGVVMPMNGEVPAKLLYPAGNYRDLDFYGTRVVVTAAVLVNY